MKMVDEKLTPEGLCTVVLFADYDPDEDHSSNGYYFQVNSDKRSPAKSPMGMFDQDRIPNDLQAVVNRIDEYYTTG